MASGLLKENLNLLWASLMVQELIKNGINTFFISPGNRNAPLIAALAHNASARKISVLDERAAAYMALGFAKATGTPGVVVCTSGTALANYFPAVIEASREEIPLVVISGDRPPELVGSDANQTIDQPHIYAGYARKELNLPCPSESFPLRALLAKVDHAVGSLHGAVHINFPFRDPLIPEQAPEGPVSDTCTMEAESFFQKPGPFSRTMAAETIPAGLSSLGKEIKEAVRGLLVVGRLLNREDRDAATALAQSLGWPVFCDIGSSLKGRVPPDRELFSLDHPQALELLEEYNPSFVLQLGTGLVSKHYYGSVLNKDSLQCVLVSPRQGLRDPAHRVGLHIPVSVGSFARALKLENSPPAPQGAAEELFLKMARLQKALNDHIASQGLSYPAIARAVMDQIPGHAPLFLGNSLAIRAFDAASPRPGESPVIVSNRGASGIEGNLASAAGFALGAGRAITAVVGDVSFLHDLNSLKLVKESPVPLIVVVVNNRGGRIFERLPVHDYPEISTPCMTTPHEMDFRHAARQFALAYEKADTVLELENLYKSALESKTSQVLEVNLSSKQDLKLHRELLKIRV